MKNYPTGYPENIFLKDLNSQSWVNNLSKVNFYNIIGNTGSKKTITKFRVVDSEVPGSWEHGMPENFYDNELDQGIGYGGGDETVPLSSANGITADKKKELDSVHGDLPTEAQCYVFEELTGKDGCESVSTFNRITDILTFGVFSPVDIQVVAPDGKWAGKNIKGLGTDKQISGAYYSGYDFGDGPDNEFLTIPISKDNSEDGEYKITTEGTDNGSYKIKMAKISEDESGLGVGSTAEISGIATAGIQEEKIVKVVDDKITIGEVDITPPIITGHATTQPNADGWYNQDVTIHFSATDESGIASVTSDVVLDREGENLSVTGMATDNFGNTASTIVGGINIDKTVPEIKIIAPENKIYMNNKMVEIKHSASDNLTASSDLKKEIFLDGSLINANKIDLSLAHLGAHDISVKATDKAGNKKEVKSDFQVKTGLGAIISNVDHYFDLGLITKRPTKIVLQVRLEAIGGKILLLDILESKWMPWWTRERAVENMKREINRDIETLKNQINSQKNFSENIDQKARELLIESLDKIKP